MRQPSIKEISYIGGDSVLFQGCELLKFSKDNLKTEDKINLSNQTDFNILMSIMREKNGMLKPNVEAAESVLTLLFPNYTLRYTPTTIELLQDDIKCGEINNQNFLIFKQLLVKIFCLEQITGREVEAQEVQGEFAKKIAEKLQRRQQKLAEIAAQKTGSIAIFSRYTSILAVGLQKSINSLMEYTVYQLFDEFRRYELKMKSDVFFQARMAGAKDLKEPEDWMKDIHSQGE